MSVPEKNREEAAEALALKILRSARARLLLKMKYLDRALVRLPLRPTDEWKIACDGDCNPLHGPRIRDIIESLESGKEVDKYWYVEEELYAGDDTVRSVTIDDTEYPVTVVTEELIAGRKY